MSSAPPKVFISYSRADEAWKDRLLRHLKVVELGGELSIWDDSRIATGDEWLPAIEAALLEADVAVLLISADFLTSDFIRRKEVPALLRRRSQEGVRIFPLIVKACPWQTVDWLAEMQLRPKGARPLAERKRKIDSELAALALEIRDLASPKTKTERKTGTETETEIETEVLPPAREAVLAEWFAQVADEHRRLADHFERPVELWDLEKAWVRLDLALPEDGSLASGEDASLESGRFGYRSLDDFLALDPAKHSWVTRRWLVQGDPGSGKTTLLRHLAGRLAKLRDPERIPVFVSLPRLVKPLRPILEYLGEEYGPLCGRQLPGLLDRAGRQGKLLILLDGLDEVRPDLRERVRRLLARLERDWPRSSVVLTSRPIGLGRPPPEFNKLLLQPFGDDQRRRFLERWFEHRARPDFAADAERAGAHFDSERSLRELSRNPLHLTLLTVLWETGVEAPTRRSQLYDAIFELLIEGRHRDPPVAIEASADVREALRYLAFGLTRDDLPAEPPGQLEQRLREPEVAPTATISSSWNGPSAR